MTITPELWEKMNQSIQTECKDLDNEKTGISIVLWRLRSLMDGYKYALDHGYTGAP